jgi:hypothetical protein
MEPLSKARTTAASSSVSTEAVTSGVGAATVPSMTGFLAAYLRFSQATPWSSRLLDLVLLDPTTEVVGFLVYPKTPSEAGVYV